MVTNTARADDFPTKQGDDAVHRRGQRRAELRAWNARHRRAAAARGKTKFIAITAPKRQPAFPDVPTAIESGAPAGYEVAEPDVMERFATFGYDAFPVTRDQFNAFIAAESAKCAAVIKRAKVSLDWNTYP
jgi:hypothetical protein